MFTCLLCANHIWHFSLWLVFLVVIKFSSDFTFLNHHALNIRSIFCVHNFFLSWLKKMQHSEECVYWIKVESSLHQHLGDCSMAWTKASTISDRVIPDLAVNELLWQSNWNSWWKRNQNWHSLRMCVSALATLVVTESQTLFVVWSIFDDDYWRNSPQLYSCHVVRSTYGWNLDLMKGQRTGTICSLVVVCYKIA